MDGRDPNSVPASPLFESPSRLLAETPPDSLSRESSSLSEFKLNEYEDLELFTQAESLVEELKKDVGVRKGKLIDPSDTTDLRGIETVISYLESIKKGWITKYPFCYEKYENNLRVLRGYMQCPAGRDWTPYAIQADFSMEGKFLCLGFQLACASLLHTIKQQLSLRLNSQLVFDACAIVSEELNEFQKNNVHETLNAPKRSHFDVDTLLERIERLYRVRVALENPNDAENNRSLGLLAERSGSKSYVLFFLGLVMLTVSVAVIVATHGVAIPYLTSLFADTTLAINASTLAGAGVAGGIGILWWRHHKKATTERTAAAAFCCFWHHHKQAIARGLQPEPHTDQQEIRHVHL